MLKCTAVKIYSCQWVRFSTDLAVPHKTLEGNHCLASRYPYILKHSLSLCDNVQYHKYLSIFGINPLVPEFPFKF